MNILNTSKKFLKAGVCAIMLITAGQAQAQQVTVDASIDSLQLLIGEQAKVKLEISMDDAAAFNDMKEYLSEQQIGFREIYDGERMTLQFLMCK